MTPEQRLHKLRTELAVNADLGRLIAEVAHDYAFSVMRKCYSTNDAGLIIRQTGMAEGAELFVSSITKPPSTAP